MLTQSPIYKLTVRDETTMSTPDSVIQPVPSTKLVTKPHKERVRRSITPRKLKRIRQEAFLGKLTETGSVTQSAAHAGVNLCTPYQWCEVDQDFKQAMESARALGEKTVLACLEEEIQRRALAGKEDSWSANLLMFRTKRLDPSYRDNAQVNVNAVGPVAIQFNLHVPQNPERDSDTAV